MTPSPGLVVGGKYELVKSLGAGGMGALWIARHTQLDVSVAVKFMAQALAGTLSAETRFEREAKAAAQLKSPHIVRIYDYGVEDGTPYMAMELLEGEDLGALLDREGRLSIARASELIGQACKALRAAHEAGIVHRDLKPANLFLARESGETILKVLDFGIAKETAASPSNRDPTTTGTVLGSPLYMSPEQARAEAVDTRADLWSLGVVAFELITGAHPFSGKSVWDVMVKICAAERPEATEVAPDLPAEVDAFFTKALARKPEGRFSSAREMAAAFEELTRAAPQNPGRTVVVPKGAARGREAETLAIDGATRPVEPSRPEDTRSVVVAPAEAPNERSRLRWFAIGIAAALSFGGALMAFRPKAAPSVAAPSASSSIEPAPAPVATLEPKPSSSPAITSSAPPVASSAPSIASSAPAIASSTPSFASSAPSSQRPDRRPAPPRASATATPKAPAIDPFSGLPVKP